MIGQEFDQNPFGEVARKAVARRLDHSEAETRQIGAANPFGRLGQPDDIARAVAFLVGPEGGWINGQVIRANGGIV